MIKTKIKPILPSLREKKRYVVFEAILRRDIAGFNVSEAIKTAFSRFAGMHGAAKAGLIVLENKWNPQLRRGIVKVGHKHVDAFKASLVLAGGDEVVFRSIGVSGILKKAENKFMKN